MFFIVRENRTYDQVLGDDARGDGDSKLTLFGNDVTPNLHALATRFPLVDHVYANSEASQQGHMWTSAANVSDHMEKSWNQISNLFGDYGARGRPLETGVLAVSFPPKGFLFDQADPRQGSRSSTTARPTRATSRCPTRRSAAGQHVRQGPRAGREPAAQAKFANVGPRPRRRLLPQRLPTSAPTS